jgi:SAM-dependent methyltransferase
MWSAVAPAWGQHAAHVDERGAAVAELMLALSAPRAGERVLELACGAGGLGLAAADRVGLSGEVVLSDVADEMTQLAASRAHEQGVENVSARVLDLEAVQEPDASYDVVLCREGLMFAFDPRGAASEIARVLRPGGRFVAAVWGPRERNPWLAIVLDAASAQLGKPVPPPGMPGPFSLAERTELADVLCDAGFADVGIDEVPVPARAGSLDEWWGRTCALAGPLSAILGSLDERERLELRQRALGSAEAYAGADGVEFPGLTLVASAVIPR